MPPEIERTHSFIDMQSSPRNETSIARERALLFIDVQSSLSKQRICWDRENVFIHRHAELAFEAPAGRENAFIHQHRELGIQTKDLLGQRERIHSLICEARFRNEAFVGRENARTLPICSMIFCIYSKITHYRQEKLFSALG
jgi:hypothetical protein